MIWEWVKRKSTGNLRVVFIVYCGDREQQRAIKIKLKLKLKFLMPLPTRVWCSKDINQTTWTCICFNWRPHYKKITFRNCQKINAWYTLKIGLELCMHNFITVYYCWSKECRINYVSCRKLVLLIPLIDFHIVNTYSAQLPLWYPTLSRCITSTG